VMGNNHNLFGVPHEAHIFIGEDGPHRVIICSWRCPFTVFDS
jgi:arginine decarboxylase-like protein